MQPALIYLFMTSHLNFARSSFCKDEKYFRVMIKFCTLSHYNCYSSHPIWLNFCFHSRALILDDLPQQQHSTRLGGGAVKKMKWKFKERKFPSCLHHEKFMRNIEIMLNSKWHLPQNTYFSSFLIYTRTSYLHANIVWLNEYVYISKHLIIT